MFVTGDVLFLERGNIVIRAGDLVTLWMRTSYFVINAEVKRMTSRCMYVVMSVRIVSKTHYMICN